MVFRGANPCEVGRLGIKVGLLTKISATLSIGLLPIGAPVDIITRVVDIVFNATNRRCGSCGGCRSCCGGGSCRS